jgi:D-serine deaminase-like pyridoxal phosphate-dependent protein
MALNDYQRLRELVHDQPLPLMVVDLDAMDANVRRLAEVARQHGKNLRVASKSVRVPDLLKRIVAVGGEHFRGLMCFSVPEARLLAGEGFDDLLVAYPTVQRSDLEVARDVVASGKTVTLMIDSPTHVAMLADFWRAHGGGEPLRVCIDQDMSWRPGKLHIGAQRSPVRSVEDFAALLDAVLARPELRLAGVMGYEAQIAGVGDRNPFAPLLNPAKKLIKAQSVKDVAAKRRAVSELLLRRGVSIDFFNGGGTGSIRTTSEEDWITEVTAGSGFLQSHLFDYYAGNRNQPAMCFALQVTRIPQPDRVTCQSGGFIASGASDPDKAPVPFLPAGLKPDKMEGFGEVQTPLIVPEDWRGVLGPGDPIFFRPAKAGEIAERFNDYLLIEGGAVVGRAKTYRGMGYCFH